MTLDARQLSIVLPAKNEASGLRSFLPKLRKAYPESEIIVVDDGSSDNTREVCEDVQIRVVSHPYSKGNGAAIKTGARAASRDVLVFMDADGQHNPDDISRLMTAYDQGYAMVVGARHRSSQANRARALGNTLYNRLASWMCAKKVEDLTSGFRIVNREKFLQFLYLLPNGFSYPTTITMAFFRAGYAVGYIPIEVAKRIGRSHLRISKDGVRFLLIIFKIGTLYSPLKVFVPISMMFFVTGGGYSFYTLLLLGRFTNMSALLLSISMVIFLIGLVSEQVTMLIYKGSG